MANTYVNKVQLADGTSLIDISDTTATADKILSGYTAYGADGSKLTGTASSGGSVTQDQDGFIVLPPTGGGGGGSNLIVESGTYEPLEDTNHPTISFANTHSTLPIYAIIYDSTGTSNSADDNFYCSITNFYELYSGINLPNGTYWYARMQGAYASSTTGTASGSNIASLSGSTTTSLPYYLTTSEFSPWVNNTRYFRSGRTYTWIAVWAPTT